ncbi:TfoX/Sxy family DNA transformation protein [Nocardia tengchongensis]|uniref:TfoX/Sxy family DNA transformation protein n=1 Tax=Nocardia tengchongensis TaxID=2055889 RepID=UPI00369EE66D
MKQQRTATARSVTDGLKLHRHVVRAAGRVHTVITLRPGTDVRFSTNRFHDTWHVLSDDHGARLLARLLWGLSYQARPGTVVLIDRAFLTPTPFEAESPDPIVLVPGWCTPFDERVAGEFKRRLPLVKPEGTVRWHTFGLDRTVEPGALDDWWGRYRRREHNGRVSHSHGFVVLTPSSPDESRAWALQAMRLNTQGAFGTDYTYLGPFDRSYEGEIQVFRGFRSMVSVAGRARTRVLSRPDAPDEPEALRPAIWNEAEIIRGDAHLRVREWNDSGYRLGHAAAVMLAHAGVADLDDLAAIGSVEAYRRMRAAGLKGLDLEMLWAMEGALTYRDRRNVTAERRGALLAELGTETAPEQARPRRRRYRAPINPAPHRSGRGRTP